ncbi:hypothetical protein ATPR_1729 [Acetobacter tropicalis NBRC 101654]|uniref:Uncharacterized protein n=1 Tax=Acetobacter tropicalis NBRC 101654 TaxID=749388 RepID=F7VED0_9PROT|nr:hypothetical protein ATPR_1729 [Acetobacter tropicalis NBRC 101654]
MILPQPARNLTSCRPLFGTPCALFLYARKPCGRGDTCAIPHALLLRAQCRPPTALCDRAG